MTENPPDPKELTENRSEPLTPEEAARVMLDRLRSDTSHRLFGVFSPDETDSVNFLIQLFNNSTESEIGMIKFERDGIQTTAFFNADKSLLYWLSGQGDERIKGPYSFVSFNYFVQERLREHDFGQLIRPWVENEI